MRDPSVGVHFGTLAIHAGSRASPRGMSVSAGHGEGLLASADPALSVLEERIAALEDGSAAVAVPSIETARLVALQALMQPGDEVVVARGYGMRGGHRLEEAVGCFGWNVRRAEPDRPESLVDALSDRSKAILVETSTGEGVFRDIEAIGRVAQRARLPLIVDNTLATPYLLRPLELGADVVLHDARAYLGGFEDAKAAFIVDGGSFDWAGDARFPAISGPRRQRGAISDMVGNFAFVAACRAIAARSVGQTVSRAAAKAILQGVETLPLRMERHCGNALAAARFVERHPAVHGVTYAGLEADAGFALARRFRGAGARLSFKLVNAAFVERFAASVNLFTVGADAFGSRSAVLYPAGVGRRHRG